MRLVPLFLLVLAACHRDEAVESVRDLSERLRVGEVRAGVITSEAALFAGISAEGRVGDYKIYNGRVQFVIQGIRPGSYYLAQSGSVIDADVVRAEGELGRDAIDEWQGMFGFGRLIEADSITVVESGAPCGEDTACGSESPVAKIRVEGHESPMALIQGVVENKGIVPDLGLRFVTEYELRPDANVLMVRTTVTGTRPSVSFQPGDILLGGMEVLEAWNPGVGLGKADGGAWTALVGRRNDVAYGLGLPEGEVQPSNVDLLASVLSTAMAFGELQTLAVGDSYTWARLYVVGHDLAEVTDAIAAARGEQTGETTGVVIAPDGPVEGARVNLFADGLPYTFAVTGPNGVFSANTPRDATISMLAEGRGTSLFFDFTEGAVPYAPYAAASVQQAVLDRLAGDLGPGPALASGRGVAGVDSPLVLGEAAVLVVRSDEQAPFSVRALAVLEDDPVDPRVVRWRPSGYAGVGWARDGEVRLEVEPGTYHLVGFRGIQYELDEADVTVVAGEEKVVAFDLPRAYSTGDYLLGDPHMHASPSADSTVTMEERVLDAAAMGLQLHFGTDHDHVADYRPLTSALGIESQLHSVVADEVSSVMRGHMNAYPLTAVPEEPNGGAWLWWSDIVSTTSELFSVLRANYGDFILQANHPQSSGIASSAQWEVGKVGKPDFWDPDFDAVEVENNGDYSTAFFSDLVSRGIRVTPVGVSDVHGYFERQGLSATFIGVGTDDVEGYSDDALREAMRAHRTIVTRGPFLEMSLDPGSEVRGPVELRVQSRSPSYIRVDRLVLHRDGARVQVKEGVEATFDLSPDEDAVYWVSAEGDSPMAPMWALTPWAMSAPIWVDVGEAGWTPPLPPLTLRP